MCDSLCYIVDVVPLNYAMIITVKCTLRCCGSHIAF